jgi:hypothetical protein
MTLTPDSSLLVRCSSHGKAGGRLMPRLISEQVATTVITLAELNVVVLAAHSTVLRTQRIAAPDTAPLSTNAAPMTLAELSRTLCR